MADNPYEPAADSRQFAKQMKDMFEAFMQAGFSERQALAIVGDIVRGVIQRA